MLTKIAHFVHRLERLENAEKKKKKKRTLEAQQMSFQQRSMLSVQKACFSWTSRNEYSRLLASLLTLRL